MSTVDLSHTLNTVGKQLKGVTDGLSEELMDAKLHDGAMSPRETLEHLTECYVAYLAHTKGEEHSWGTFAVPDNATDVLKTACFSKREEAVAAAISSQDDGIRNAAMDYIALHDAYHVGQIASLRVAKEPDWNAYAIYE